MKEIKSLILVLKNCEEITINREHIGSFWCGDITSEIARIACNSISKHQHCKEFYIEINKNANLHYSLFGNISEIFERLSAYPDITGINITYQDDTEEYCLMPWKDSDESGCNNEYQSSLVSECGNMYIYIGKKQSVNDVVDLETINDPETMDTIWTLYSEKKFGD